MIKTGPYFHILEIATVFFLFNTTNFSNSSYLWYMRSYIYYASLGWCVDKLWVLRFKIWWDFGMFWFTLSIDLFRKLWEAVIVRSNFKLTSLYSFQSIRSDSIFTLTWVTIPLISPSSKDSIAFTISSTSLNIFALYYLSNFGFDETVVRFFF